MSKTTVDKLIIVVKIEVIWTLICLVAFLLAPSGGHPSAGLLVVALYVFVMAFLLFIGLMFTFTLLNNKEDKTNPYVATLIDIQWVAGLFIFILILFPVGFLLG